MVILLMRRKVGERRCNTFLFHYSMCSWFCEHIVGRTN